MSCTTTTPLVTFSYQAWSALFPQLAGSVNATQAGLYFDLASELVSNAPSSLFSCDIPRLTSVLNLLTAHWATLFSTINGQPPSPLVGRIDSATQGSVSVSADVGPPSLTAAWFQQTPYGYAAWQLMAGKRTARYLPGPRPYLGSNIYNVPGRWPGWQ